MSKVRISLASVALLLVAVAAAAQGPLQPRTGRPDRALFGGGVGSAEQLLSATVVVAGGAEDDRIPQDGTPTLVPRRTTYGSASGELRYTLGLKRVSLSAAAVGAMRYFPELEQPLATRALGSLGGSVQLTTRTTLAGALGLARQPYQLLSVLGAELQALDEPLDVSASGDRVLDNAWAQDYSLSLSHRFSRRFSVSAGGAYQSSRGPSNDRRFSVQTINAQFRYALSRDLTAYAGYARSEGRFDHLADGVAASVPRTQGADVGVDFSRGLSLTRRTSLTFSTGTSTLVDDQSRRLRLMGGVRLGHEFGRTWSAGVAVRRAAGFDRTLQAPVFSDSVTADVTGLLSRRMQVAGALSAARGGVGVSDTNPFDNATGRATLTMGVTRSLGLSINYVAYRFAFAPGIVLPEGLPSSKTRHSVTASLSLWAPLFHRRGTSNASR